MRGILSIRGLRRGIIGAGLLLLLAVMTGCSTLRLAYGQGPALAYWWLDGQLDFDSQQELQVKEALRQAFAWHQQTQLGRYASEISGLRTQALQTPTAAPLTGEQVCRWSDTAGQLVEAAVDRVLPAAAAIALTLRPAQLQRLESRYAKKTAELRADMLQEDLAERREAALERAVKRFEDFYGRLEPDQRRLLAESLVVSPFDAAGWLAQRDERQAALMNSLRAIVRDRPPAAQVQAQLRLLALGVTSRVSGRAAMMPPVQAQEASKLAAFNCELTARLHNSSNPAQRRHLVKKLQGWEGDLNALASQPLAAEAPSQAAVLGR